MNAVCCSCCMCVPVSLKTAYAFVELPAGLIDRLNTIVHILDLIAYNMLSHSNNTYVPDMELAYNLLIGLVGTVPIRTAFSWVPVENSDQLWYGGGKTAIEIIDTGFYALIMRE